MGNVKYLIGNRPFLEFVAVEKIAKGAIVVCGNNRIGVAQSDFEIDDKLLLPSDNVNADGFCPYVIPLPDSIREEIEAV
jgi:hypothetical protein